MSNICEPINDLCSAMGVVEREAAKNIWKSKDWGHIALCGPFTRCSTIWHSATGKWPNSMSLHRPEQDWPSGYCRRLGKRLGNSFALLLDGTGLIAEGLDEGLDDDGLDYMMKRARRRARREAREEP